MDKEVGAPVVKPVIQKTTTDDRKKLRQAVNRLVAKVNNKGIMDYDDAYTMVNQFMNVLHIDEIPFGDLPKAVAYVHSLIMTVMPQPQIAQTNEQLAYNEMMRYRGLLQLDNINKTISELQLAALNVSQQLDRLKQLTPVINDAFAMPTYPMPVNVDEVRQLAMIRLASRNAAII